MRKLLLFVGLALLLSTSVEAQQRRTLASGASYADSQTDTLSSPTSGASFSRIGRYSRVSLYVVALDSILVKVYIDVRPVGGSWSLVDSVVVNDAATPYVAEHVLRDNTTEGVSGVFSDIRVRPTFQDSANGVTSATYSLDVIYTR